eukprot:6149932-Prymnesium_polylepis.1
MPSFGLDRAAVTTCGHGHACGEHGAEMALSDTICTHAQPSARGLRYTRPPLRPLRPGPAPYRQRHHIYPPPGASRRSGADATTAASAAAPSARGCRFPAFRRTS